jgi:ABC-type transport system involved in multi-copper enzyme maturation permease subunit
MHDALTIAHLTISEARRRKIVMAALVCAAAFLIVFSVAVFFAVADLRKTARTFLERQGFLTLMAVTGLYASNFLSVLFAVLLPVDTLSGEIDSGVMQTIASKPIRRADIVIGKWLGHGVIVLAYLCVLVAGVLASIRIFGDFVPVNLGRALPLMALEVTLLLTVSIAGGTRLSTVTNGVVALGFYGVAFIGGWIEQVGAIGGIPSARTVGIVVSLISPPDAMWRMAAYYLQPAIMRGIRPNVFSVGSMPAPPMIWWTAAFLVLTLVWAVRSFQRRSL